jgi:hypothetical protein
MYFICRMAIGESGVTSLTAAATDLSLFVTAKVTIQISEAAMLR